MPAQQGRGLLTVVQRAKAVLAQVRSRHPVLDHAVAAVGHYNRMQGRNLAGAVTYFGFLSLFPLIAITYAAPSHLVRFYPGAREVFTSWLADNLPGLTGPGGIDVDAIAEWTRGAYAASFDLGGLVRYGADLRTAVGPIHFACSDLAGSGYQHVDGAIRMGDLVGSAVVEELSGARA